MEPKGILTLIELFKHACKSTFAIGLCSGDTCSVFKVLLGLFTLTPELCVDDLRKPGIVLRLFGVISSLLVIVLFFGIEFVDIFALTACLSLRVFYCRFEPTESYGFIVASNLDDVRFLCEN